MVHCLWFIFYREWYSYHFPELVKIVNDNHMYTRVAQLIRDRKTLTEESLEPLEEIVMDSAKAQAILDASRSSMGEKPVRDKWSKFSEVHGRTLLQFPKLTQSS